MFGTENGFWFGGAMYDCVNGICCIGATGCGACIGCGGWDGTSGKNPIFCNANLAALAFASFLLRLVAVGWNIWPLICT